LAPLTGTKDTRNWAAVDTPSGVNWRSNEDFASFECLDDRDILGVAGYTLFDHFAEYLDPPLTGFRRQAGDYLPMAVLGGLPSEVLEIEL
jgi:hypothetical protein